MGKHEVHMRRSWTDGEPDTLTVSVQSSWDTGERYTVFTTNSTWLNRGQVLELQEYLSRCLEKMAEDEGDARPAFRLVKDGQIWDYSNLQEDVEAWREKILREEPYAGVEIQPSTRAEMLAWKEG